MLCSPPLPLCRTGPTTSKPLTQFCPPRRGLTVGRPRCPLSCYVLPPSIPLQGGTDDVSADASPTKKRRGRPPSIPPPRVRLAALAALGSLDGGGPPGDSSDEDDNNDGDNKDDDEDYDDDEGEGGAAAGGGGRPRKVQRTTTPQPVSGSGVAAVPTSAAAAAGAGAGAGRDGTPLPEGFPEGLNPDFLPPEVSAGGGEGGWIVQ